MTWNTLAIYCYNMNRVCLKLIELIEIETMH